MLQKNENTAHKKYQELEDKCEFEKINTRKEYERVGKL